MPQSERPDYYDFHPWGFFKSPDEVQLRHRRWLEQLTRRLLADGGEVELADPVFISSWASVHTSRLKLGQRCYIAAHSYVSQEVEAGDNCTLNPFTIVRGKIKLGNGVRIGAQAQLLGFNHGTAPDKPVFQQPTTSVGIEVGDDVWIGSNVVIVDGVKVGAHCIIGAGAVVTKDLPEWSVAVGNPARVIRDRREPRGARAAGQGLGARLDAFASKARSQAVDVLDRAFVDDRFLDRPGREPTVRAWCDAVEIADLLLGSAPPQVPAEQISAHLRELQDPKTGLVPEYGEDSPPTLGGAATYHILCVGYALQLLGTPFEHPVHAVQDLTPGELAKQLDALPWSRRAWGAGSFIDSIGTAYYRNLADFDLRAESTDALFGWLLRNASPWHGMWGTPDNESRWHQVVNGFYRLTRGTYAQFGLPLPYPERAIDTLLTHSVDVAYFGPARGTACDVLDVIHPLWLCAKQTPYRRPEGEAWARRQLDRALSKWQDGQGFTFYLEPGTDELHSPGLQGTEMWLAIIWLLADYLGESEALGYKPRGVHRPDPAATL
ncbi:acyltransferase [Flindersiella endophytica]